MTTTQQLKHCNSDIDVWREHREHDDIEVVEISDNIGAEFHIWYDTQVEIFSSFEEVELRLAVCGYQIVGEPEYGKHNEIVWWATKIR